MQRIAPLRCGASIYIDLEISEASIYIDPEISKDVDVETVATDFEGRGTETVFSYLYQSGDR
jgi:hypothetical protein